ncbi:MAG TPA: tripartite tricarboxylate transporter substrate binding protein [Ramlibacter sp.]|nr:tripartite tricarboxylate transporter substrate binding protein [Ramlibacter sp.]
MKRRDFMDRAGAAAALFAGWPAVAQEAYPDRPVRLIVPYAAGGGLDVVARIVGERLGQRLGQPFVVDNRTGASGMVGADAVAKAKADGYTLLATVADTQINNAVLFKQIPYDPLTDFVPVTQMAYGSPVMVVPADVPAKNLAEFVAWAKTQRGKLSYGSWGIGGLGHLMTEAFNQAAGLDMNHAPYRGEAAMLQDLLGKSVALGMGSVTNMAPHVQRGSLRAIALSGSQRAAALPGTGTFAEQGFQDPVFAARVWMALLAPAKTPPSIVEKLQREVRAILQDAAVQKELTSRGFEPVGNTPGEFGAALKRDYEVLTALIRKIGIQPQ